MKKLSALATLFYWFINTNTNAQTQNWEWAKSTGGTSVSSSVATDPSGNVFVVGEFQGTTINFGTTTLTNINTSTRNIFVVKYGSTGNIIWAKGGGGLKDDYANSVSTDLMGNCYVAGSFGDSITFGSTTLYGNQSISSHFFIVKYNSGGNVVWAKGESGGGGGGATSVANDGYGNAYVAGFIASPSIVIGTDTLLGSIGLGMFLAKYDANGNAIWAKGGGSSSNIGSECQANAIDLDQYGNIFLTGSFYGDTITLGSSRLHRVNPNSSDVFTVKYDSSGNVKWAKNAAADYPKSITTDLTGNSYVTGYFASQSVLFGTTTLTNTGYGAMFIVKYDSVGNVVWAKGKSGNGQNIDGISVNADATGNIYLAGYFNGGSIAFGTSTLNGSIGGGSCGACYNFFLVKYDGAGNVLWLKGGSNIIADFANGVTTDTFGNCIIAGSFNTGSGPDTLFMGTIPLVASTNNVLGIPPINMFVAKLANQNISSGFEDENNSVLEGVKVFPNPSNGNIYFRGVNNGNTVEIYDFLGEIVYSSKVIGDKNFVNLSSKSGGIYFYRIIDMSNIIQQGKIVVAR